MKHIIPRLIYGLNEKLTARQTFKSYNELKKTQSYSEEQLAEFQFEKLKRLLIHARDYTDYYKEAFAVSSFDPQAMESALDLRKAPLLKRSMIRKAPSRFISSDRRRKLSRLATSGSTGEPLIFYLSNERVSANKAAYLMLYEWWGLQIGDKEVVFWGSPRDFTAYNIAKKIRDRLLNTHLLPAFNMSATTMFGYLDFIKRYRPKDIFGYAHSIYLLARYARNRGISMRNAAIRVVFTTAEVLHGFQRKTIEEVFGCPVSNCYGGRDSGLVAFECPAGSMHINPNIITEVIKDATPVGEGIKGEIVVTDIDSYGMPFIRYCTGDEGVVGNRRCACGRPYPIMDEIIGRDTDYVVSPSGEFIHPLALEYIFRELEGIDYFKIVQEKEDKLVVTMSVNDRFEKKLETDIKARIDGVMGVAIETIFRYVGQDEIGSEGKYKFVVSEVIKKYL
ncbi:MAG: phenylacetate--CoA ligase family protein [Candidatus Omnitrophica bacterium]|nr:phenylacetate--CoA ligase family protein [Candidatus Omnitrophota bacterium]MCM8791337.1 phenylacetate--CoA ligase family protein [Candidatus Omnitrophota bacterium]